MMLRCIIRTFLCYNACQEVYRVINYDAFLLSAHFEFFYEWRRIFVIGGGKLRYNTFSMKETKSKKYQLKY